MAHSIRQLSDIGTRYFLVSEETECSRFELVLLWCQDHNQLTPFHFRKLFNCAVVFKVLLDPFQKFDTQLLMSHLTTAVTQRNLGTVPVRQEINQLLELDVVVADVCAGTKLNFLDLDLLSLGFAALGLFLLFKKILTEIHNSANRWFSIRRYFDEI